MKTKIYTLIFVSLLLASCSSASEKDSIIHEQLETIIVENESWLKRLESFSAEDSTVQLELRRHFFSNQSTSSSAYSQVSMIVRYFDVDRKNLERYKRLIDDRDHLLSSFFSCSLISEEEVEQLISIEKEILSTLEKISKMIDS